MRGTGFASGDDTVSRVARQPCRNSSTITALGRHVCKEAVWCIVLKRRLTPQASSGGVFPASPVTTPTDQITVTASKQ